MILCILSFYFIFTFKIKRIVDEMNSILIVFINFVTVLLRVSSSFKNPLNNKFGLYYKLSNYCGSKLLICNANNDVINPMFRRPAIAHSSIFCAIYFVRRT
jgi:hypothetical protein